MATYLRQAAIAAIGACGLGLALTGCGGGSPSGAGASGAVVLTDAHQVVLCDQTVIDTFTVSIARIEIVDRSGATQQVYPNTSSPTSLTVDLLSLHNSGDIVGAFSIPGSSPAIRKIKLAMDPSGTNEMTVAPASPNYPAGTALAIDLSGLPVGAAGPEWEVEFRPPLPVQNSVPVVFDFRPSDSIRCDSSTGTLRYMLQPELHGYSLVNSGLAVRTFPARVVSTDCAGDVLRVTVHPLAHVLFEVNIASAALHTANGAPASCAAINPGDRVLLRGTLNPNGSFDATDVTVLPAGGGHAGGPAAPPPGQHPIDVFGRITAVNIAGNAGTFDLLTMGGHTVHVTVSTSTRVEDDRQTPAAQPWTAALLATGQFVEAEGILDFQTATLDPTSEVEIKR
jgi:hypothetical protein